MMKRRLSVLILMSMMLGSMTFFPTNASTENFSAEWILVQEASDDFDGTALDTSKWNTELWSDVSCYITRDEENVTVEDGCLILSAKAEYKENESVAAGGVESRFQIPGTASGLKSYVEVRAKAMDTRTGIVSAIWMQTFSLCEENNPNPEIDMMETAGTDENGESVSNKNGQSTLHIWPTDSAHIQIDCEKVSSVDLSEKFHTYGLEREKNTLRFYFDGDLYWERECSDYLSLATMDRSILLTLEGFVGMPNVFALTSTFQIDYVHTYISSSD